MSGSRDSNRTLILMLFINNKELKYTSLSLSLVMTARSLTVITKCFRREHFTQLHNIRVLQLLPHLHDRHTLCGLQTESWKIHNSIKYKVI